ncbi:MULTISPECIES: DMT family transporter [Variovorax]|jgi:drug/metabolite transporter (DMT)-like permease|uniref:DMT family transporter n=1 Tax=Variovorax TaxID=34072 RepID=UPI00086F559A|nr:MULTISPECIES: DMT family transporter [Variovorax]MBN8752638.1 DMT family transporter [Variovorax sp.]ODU16275.1 MAG: transporter [Variovorax sp. SCN 67-85]ODV26026.1 MAG: transporter [Variovorax sp. SCN 67-20]OJZ10239.1 MAG: transporter [Variovorax sp. 67-131]UKI06870.1 DMT family transporter [Variovorax paradoxus]
MDKKNLRTGVLAALAAALIGSAWQLASRHGVTTTLGPMELVLLRYGIPALLLAPLWLGKGLIPPKAPRLALVLLVIGGGLPFGLLVLAGARWAPASHMGILMASSLPLFTAIGAWLHKRQKVGGIRLLGLGCIAAGIALFAAESFRGGSLDWRGNLLFLAAAVLWTVHSLAFAHCGFTPWQGAAFVNGWSSLLLLPLLVTVGAPRLLTAPWTDVALQAAMQGVVAGLLGLVAYLLAVERLGAARASLSAALVPVLTTLGAAAWMNEPITNEVLLALSLVVPGIVLASGAVRWPARAMRPRS